MMKKTLFFLFALIISTVINAQSGLTVKYEIKPGETLYSIARTYNVTVARLLELNPGLKSDFIMAGQKINVPANVVAKAETPSDSLSRPKYKTTYEVQKKETIYSISRKYGITEDKLIEANPILKESKLKKGAIINIPYTDEEDNEYLQKQIAKKEKEEEEKRKKEEAKKYDAINVAVILPFCASNEKMSIEAQKMTNLYQGFLLAVDSLKQRGYSVNVYAYDEASPVSEHLQKKEMKSMHLIIGPMRQNNQSVVAKFAHENNIAHVVPISTDLSLVNEHPTTFQVNTHTSVIYNIVYNRFISIHSNDNIILVNTNDRGDNVAYINGLKAALDAQEIKYNMVDISNAKALQEMLSTTQNNVIVPYSSTPAAFGQLCQKLNTMGIPENCAVQMFGFPEWQTFTSKYKPNLNKYKCQFFTSFYSNANSPRTQQFNSTFKRWFNQNQYNSFPHYGEFGYDIGVYFIKGLHDYGSAFYENLHNISYNSLEFPFFFEKKNTWSGYQNKSVMIVTCLPDGTVTVQ